MSDLKEVKMTVPNKAPRKRRTQKAGPALAKVPTATPVPTPMIPVAQAAGGVTVAVGGKKKPTLKIPLPYAESKNAPTPVSLLAKKITGPPAQKQTRVHIKPTKRKNFTMKRKFAAKKITVQIDNSSKARKTRDAITKTVSEMKLPEITAKLREKGLIREKANPPEAMQRAMMKDIMNFPTPL
jgi:hypothetical protein